MTDEKKLSKRERKQQVRDEYLRKREMLQDEYVRKVNPLWDEYERTLREIDAEDDEDD